MPASPTSWSSRPSAPGSSGTSDRHGRVRRRRGAVLARDPCVAGVAAGHGAGRARRAATLPVAAVAGAGVQGARRPAAPSSRSSASSSSTVRSAGALPARIWVHIIGSLAAIRVTSRIPWPASATALSGSSRSRAATRLAATCGTWETAATAASWSAGRHPDRRGADGDRQVAHRRDGRLARRRAGGHHPAAALEQVRLRRDRARALPPGHRVGPDVAPQVAPEGRDLRPGRPASPTRRR